MRFSDLLLAQLVALATAQHQNAVRAAHRWEVLAELLQQQAAECSTEDDDSVHLVNGRKRDHVPNSDGRAEEADDENVPPAPKVAKTASAAPSVANLPRETSGTCLQDAKAGAKVTRRKWTQEEDDRLREALQQFGQDDFRQIALSVGTRDRAQCRKRCLLLKSQGRLENRGPSLVAEVSDAEQD